MIGFDIIGNMGRLGNQMFQYASLVGIAYARNFEWCIPKENQDLTKCFTMKNLKHFGMINGSELYLHESHEFCEDLMNECPDNVTLNGYFQSEKYFKYVQKVIREDFQFKNEIVDAVNENYSESILQDAVSIVVRRYEDIFDYPGCENNHRNIPLDYYENSIKIMGENRTYIVCSNNIDWCKEQKLFQGDNFIFNHSIPDGINKGFYDLCLTSRCKDHIISNSTFSWWGAWLANGKVIAPTPWYGTALSHINTDDLYPEKWEKIEC